MKKSLVILSCLAALTTNGAEQELVKGVDFTGLTGFTPATLNQLVDNAVPASNRGLVIVSATTPDTATYPRFTNYLWQDISALPSTLKSYQTGSWVAASIGANAIQTANIANGAVTGIKIANATITTTNISTNAITTSLLADGAITGPKIASGTVSNVHLSASSVATANLQDSSVTTVKIEDGAVNGAKIASGSISNSHLSSGFFIYGTNIASGTITGTNIAQAGVVATNLAASPSSYFVPRMNSANSAIEWATPGTLQVVSTNHVTHDTTTSVIAADDSIPQIGEGEAVTSVTITPKSANSKLVITFNAMVSANAAVHVIAALFQDATSDALASSATYVTTANSTLPLIVRYVMTSGTTSATTFSIRYGVTANTGSINGPTTGRLFGGSSAAVLTVEEIY